MIGGQRGRSMIEMLGVLAIIGVLSVGGVAGYSKAMMKWKINKAVEEYNFLIQGLMEYKDNLVKSNPEVGQIKLGEFLKAANLVPDTWTTSDGLYMTDSMGNGNAPCLNNQGHAIVVDIYFAKYQNSQAAEYSYRFCEALFMDIAYPLASELHGIFLYGSGYSTITFRGTKSCEKAENIKCLQDLTLADVNKECRACIAGESGRCGAVIVF